MRDEAGFTDFVHGGAARHLRTAYLLTGNEPDANDLLQSSLANLMRVWDRVSAKGSPDSYLRTVMVNAHTSRMRRSWRREVATGMLPETAHDPYDNLDERESLRRALARLSPGERVAVVLRHVEDLPAAEVARLLDCSVGTVKSQTARGMTKLRAALTAPEASKEGCR